MKCHNNFINLNSVKAHYIEEGFGEPIIFLHGLGGCSEISWEKNIHFFSKFFKVYALDMIGHGYSDKPKRGYSLDHSNRFLNNFIESKKIKKVNLIGNSMGGLVSLSYASRFPEKVNKIILVNSGGLGKEVTPILRLSSIPLFGEIFSHPTPKKIRRSLEKIVFNKELITDKLIERIYKYKKLDGAKKAFLKTTRYGINFKGQKEIINYLPKLIAINHPTQIIWGQQDEIIPVSHAYNAYKCIKNQENRNAQLITFDCCGHWPQREKFNEFNFYVQKFLSE